MKWTLGFKRLLSLLGLFLIFATSFFASPPAVTAQTSRENAKLCMLGYSSLETFPEMQVSFRAFDTKSTFVPQNLIAGDVVLVDNGQQITPRTLKPISDLGLNLIFVIDEGNRTNSSITQAIIQRFTDRFMVDGLDKVTIFTTLTDARRTNPYLLLDTTNSKSVVEAAVKAISKGSIDYLPVTKAYREAISKIRSENLNCKTPTMILMVVGRDEVATAVDVQQITSDAASVGMPVHIIQSDKNGFGNTDNYMQITTATGGLYYQVPGNLTQEFTIMDQPVFNILKEQRTRYEAAYRSINGSAEHMVSINWAGLVVSTSENTIRFNIQLTKPVVNILTPVDGYQITRTAQQRIETGYVYDVDSLPVQFEISWQDQKPRLVNSADFIVTTSAGPKTVGTLYPKDIYNVQFNWDLREFIQEGQSGVTLQVRVVDEYGFEGLSNPVQVKILNVIPMELTKQAENPVTRYVLYGLAGLVWVLLVLLIVFWRRLNKFMKSGAIGQVVDKVRKTIVGGSRKNPLAVLIVLDGPQRLLNKEMKIYTESVTLGRDPQQADFTFFSDSNSSISGLHTKLERSNGQWRIVGISKSGNETFVDDEAIPNFHPQPIHSGQRIRMGYEGQQPVELEFRVSSAVSADTDSTTSRKTKVGQQTVSNGMFGNTDFDFSNDGNGSHPDQAPSSTQSDAADVSDSIYARFRDRK